MEAGYRGGWLRWRQGTGEAGYGGGRVQGMLATAEAGTREAGYGGGRV